jgi:hypothetical protein
MPRSRSLLPAPLFWRDLAGMTGLLNPSAAVLIRL